MWGGWSLMNLGGVSCQVRLSVPATLGGCCRLWWGVVAGPPRLFPAFFVFSFFLFFAVVGLVGVASRSSRWGPVAGCGGGRGSCGCGFQLFRVVVHWWLRWVVLWPTPAVVPLVAPSPFIFFPVCGSVFLPAVLAVSAAPWLVVRLSLGAGLCRPVRGGLSSGPPVAPWPLWSPFSGWGLSPAWAGWSLGVLAVGPVGVARGLAWLGGCPPWWGGWVASRFCGCLSCLPPLPLVGGFVLVGRKGLTLWLVPAVSCSYLGAPPPLLVFFWGGVASSSLCPPWAGACTCR